MKNVFKTEAGRNVYVDERKWEDGGTLLTFTGFYLDTLKEISDDDYYYIQEDLEFDTTI